MNEMIKIAAASIGADTVQAVNARDLHEFLEVGKDFATWIKDRIEQYDFLENQDFVCSPISGSNGRGGHNRKDYHLSLDMAKELAMVERNEKGKQARQYFIECERRAKSSAVDPMRALNDPAAMRGLLLTYTEKVLTLESRVEELEPKAAAIDRIETVSDGSFCLRDAAKILQVPERKFFEKLHQKNYIYPQDGGGWRAYSERLKDGLLEHKMTTGQKADGSEWRSTQVRVTARGMAKLALMLEREGSTAMNLQLPGMH
jgi:anti-repressor protein